ncbi:hypothetical protein AN161_12705 [Lysinibacillus sp. FJAT-14222]|nr:hypothetical protein AN161_12705 [Lysinibacillus sp. FJAT-14222]
MNNMLNKKGSDTAIKLSSLPFLVVKETIDFLPVDNLEHSRRLSKALQPRGRLDPSGKSGGAFTFVSGSREL